MGQYYYTVNLDKREFIHPHKFDDGLKLLEFGCSAGATMLGLAVLLADGNGRGGGDLYVQDPLIGSWCGDRIAICGDYADGWGTKGSVSRRFLKREEVRAIAREINGRREKIDKRQPDYPPFRSEDVNIYGACCNGLFKDISEKVIAVIRKDRTHGSLLRIDNREQQHTLRPDLVIMGGNSK